jgi:hypothetical protein
LRGETTAAARLILPLLASVPDEREWFEYQLSEVAAALDEVMLQAFVEERDYPRALAMAQKLARPECGFWWHQDRAIALAEQLPRRMREFHELKLPSPEEWTAVKGKLPRREQLTFLIERLRMLNCPGGGSFSGIDYGHDQYAVPLVDLKWAERDRWPKVINPFDELLGMDLQAEEMELLIPLLTSPDCILAFSRERFLPQRPLSLYRLQWVVGTLFEEAALEDLIDPQRLQGSSDEAQKQLEELRAWCNRWAGKSTVDRLVARLEAEQEWPIWRRTFWSLYGLDPLRASGAAVSLAHRQPERTKDMARLLVLLDRREQVGEARAWQSAADPELRFYGNVMVLAARADQDGAVLKQLMGALADADTQRVHVAVPVLLASGRPEARAFLLRCLQSKGPAGFKPTLEFALCLLRAGYAEAFALLDQALAKPEENQLYDSPNDAIRADASLVLYDIATWHQMRDVPMENEPEAMAKVRSELRAWLRREWDAIQAGKPTTIQEARLYLPWDELIGERGRWVRRL